MSLIKKINKSIEASVADFCSAIASKYELDKDELVQLWQESVSKKNKTVKKRSAYVNYSTKIRSSIIESNPDITFGEISKEISKRWKELSDAEKEKFKENDASSDKAQANSVKVSKKNGFGSKKVSELKSLCKDKGLSVNGSKTDLIERLTTSVSPSSSVHSEISSLSDLSQENYSDMTLVEIKKICKEKNISSKGNKNELIHRLLA